MQYCARVFQLCTALILQQVSYCTAISCRQMGLSLRTWTAAALFVLELVVDVSSTDWVGLVQGPTPVGVLAPVGSFVNFKCTLNISCFFASTFSDPFRWKVNNAVLIRMGQTVLSNTVSLEVTKSYITAAASVQCSTRIYYGNGTIIEVFSDTTATLTAYGISLIVHFRSISIIYMLQVLLRHHQTSHQHIPALVML